MANNFSAPTIMKQREWTGAMPQLTDSQLVHLARVTGQPYDEVVRRAENVPGDLAGQLGAMQQQIKDMMTQMLRLSAENADLKANAKSTKQDGIAKAAGKDRAEEAARVAKVRPVGVKTLSNIPTPEK